MQLDVVKDSAQTEVGSYFISNYPPFSCWTPQEIPAARSALASPNGSSTPLGLYIHIPFCRKRCKFCYFRVYTDKNASDVEVYCDALVRELALYAAAGALQGRDFEFVYFGGGTPSFLSSAQLRSLIERISRHWRWDQAREVTFECEPGTLQHNKLVAIKDIGVTRLSLGIEHFDDDVLSENGRAHKSPEIFRAYDWAREVGFDQINVDLIAGLVGDTQDKWQDTVEKTLALAPDSLTIYQMELPHNTVIAREAQADHLPAVADWATKRSWVDYAFGRFEAAGYEVSSAYTLIKKKTQGRFVYRDAVWHGADMIGTGVASFSHLAGVHYQNRDSWDEYVHSVNQDQWPLARAKRMTPQEQLIRELILQTKLGRVDASYFENKFGVDILDTFKDVYETLTAQGFLTTAEQTVTLTRRGLLCVDALLPHFFQPHYRNVRYT